MGNYTDPLNITLGKPVHKGKYAKGVDIYGKLRKTRNSYKPV